MAAPPVVFGGDVFLHEEVHSIIPRRHVGRAIKSNEVFDRHARVDVVHDGMSESGFFTTDWAYETLDRPRSAIEPGTNSRLGDGKLQDDATLRSWEPTVAKLSNAQTRAWIPFTDSPYGPSQRRVANNRSGLGS